MRTNHDYQARRVAAMRRSAFTLIEVVLALAMLAIIAAPALGLITMAARKANDRLGMAQAEALQRNIASEIEQIREPKTIFQWDFAELQDGPLTLYAARDLSTIKLDDDASLADDERHFRVSVLEPELVRSLDAAAYAAHLGRVDDLGYRMLLFEVIWPAWVETSPGVYVSNEDEQAQANRERMVLSHLVRK